MNDIQKVNWDKIKLTIVMPSYNRKNYIEQAIESVLMQKTNFDLLLVITDDASTDGSQKTISEFENKYPQMILAMYAAENKGLLANDIRVFEHMRSDYFCVLDPDDYWIDDKFLQKAVDFFETHTDYVAYGSNTKILTDDAFQDRKLYIHTSEYEKTFDGIKDHLAGWAYATHTTASVYRNVMFQAGVPDIMKNAVGTMAEASFRGDFDRYVMHLKYGKAKFVNDLVGVYRIHKNGIWQGSTMFQRKLMESRAEFDYAEFYDHLYDEEFNARALASFRSACKMIYQAVIGNKFFEMTEYDKQTFAFLMNRFSEIKSSDGEIQFDYNFKELEFRYRKFMRNCERRQLVFWGTGKAAEYLLEKYEFSTDDIAYFVDGDRNKEGLFFMGKQIVAPKNLRKIIHKYVVIVNSYYQEIFECIEKEKLCGQEEIVNLFLYDQYISRFE